MLSSQNIRSHEVKDLLLKNLQKNSKLFFLFRPVARVEARGARAPSENFRFELSFATKVEFCLLKWTAVNESDTSQVLSINVRLCIVFLLCNLELCKETRSYFCRAKNNQQR